MSVSARYAALLAALLVTAACAERPNPAEPSLGGSPNAPPEPAWSGPQASIEQARNERLARRFAVALRDDGFRAMVVRSLRTSIEREGKVHLQRFLGSGRGALRRRLAELALEPEYQLSADLDNSPPIEIYLPVPEHRSRWQGDQNVLVATAIQDHDRPVAFDTWGRRHVLDPDRPPTTPVIALGRAESKFPEPGMALDICETCFTDGDPGSPAGNGGGGASPAPGAGAGLYMTYAKYQGTFEGWLKGDPEFEVHILGQDGTSGAMKSYQCAGEKAGAPYQFDQNQVEWSGSVLLFSQAQLDGYKAQHPGQAVRILVVEDDDGACVIKTDSARVTKMFQQLVATYGVLTGGKDTTLISMKKFTKALSLLQLLRASWSMITTQDDVVGTAIEDAVAQVYAPPANWIVKGENTITNGAIRLEMH